MSSRAGARPGTAAFGPDRQRGGGLPGAIAMIGFVIALAALFTRVSSTQAAVVKDGKIRSDSADIARYAEMTFSCANTLAAAGFRCEDRTFVDVLRYDGRPLIRAPSESGYSRIGRSYLARATCEPCRDCGGGMKLDVEILRSPESGGAGTTDALRGRRRVWQAVGAVLSMECASL
jgi:hypothetical protein